MEVKIVEGEGAVLVVNVGHPVVTNGILYVRGSNVALPKLLWDFLFIKLERAVHFNLKIWLNTMIKTLSFETRFDVSRPKLVS